MDASIACRATDCRSGHGLGNGGRIDRVSLVRLDIGLHKPGRDDPGLMPYLDQPSRQPLQSRTGFHADQGFGCQVEERLERLARKFGSLTHSALAIDGINVEHLFTDIDPIGEGF